MTTLILFLSPGFDQMLCLLQLREPVSVPHDSCHCPLQLILASSPVGEHAIKELENAGLW
jgi:hypothetical protein